MLNKIYNEDCFETMKKMPIGQVDVILTSPFYNTNKKAGKTRTLENTSVKNGQYDYVRSYENVYNFIEAKNNDGSCPYNKATFSSELCEKLLRLYAPEKGIVYDSFIGTGTTAIACKKLGLKYIGSEISKKQVEWAEERLLKCSSD